VLQEYIAGLLPDASPMEIMIPLSSNALANLAALAAGMPLLEVNRLFLNTGFVKEKFNVFSSIYDMGTIIFDTVLGQLNYKIKPVTRS